MSSLPDRTARSALDPLWRGLRAVRAAITVGFYMVIAPSGYVPFALFCLLWRGEQRQRARILHRVSARGVRIMHWWLRTMRIIHFDWRKVDLGLPAGPCVVVANHPTRLDPTAMMAVLVDGCTIVKPSVYRRLLVRPLLEGAMHFEGPSLDPMSIDHVLHSAVDRLRSGMHLFVFPEGTRSPEGKLHEFGRIAFEIACRANVPIVSVALRCEPCYLSRETPLFRPPARLPRLFMERLAIDDPASCGGDSRVLRERIESRYRQWVADGMPAIVASSAPNAAGSMSPTLRGEPGACYGVGMSKITVNNHGPYRIEGTFSITDAAGKEFGLAGRTVISLCRCGHSANKPFCDGSHARQGWQSSCEARELPPQKPKV